LPPGIPPPRTCTPGSSAGSTRTTPRLVPQLRTRRRHAAGHQWANPAGPGRSG
jgi:hypothetical protein